MKPPTKLDTIDQILTSWGQEVMNAVNPQAVLGDRGGMSKTEAKQAIDAYIAEQLVEELNTLLKRSKDDSFDVHDHMDWKYLIQERLDHLSKKGTE